MVRFFESLGKVEMAIAKYSLFALSFLVLAAAVARTIRQPINWANDLATFLFAWCVFFGGDIAMRKDRLFCLSLLTDKLPAKARMYLKAANYAIILAFLVGMIFYGINLTLFTRMRTFQGIPGFSYSWVTMSVPIGCALMAATAVLKIRESLAAARGGEVAEKGEGFSEII